MHNSVVKNIRICLTRRGNLNSLSTQCGKDSKGSLKRFAAVVLGATLLAGCATFGAKPEEAVKARAQARWDALLKGDAKVAYEYFSPGSKAVLDFPSYDASI